MSNPDPGWYPDPERSGLARYFDGTTWTEHLRPIDGSGPADQPAAPDPSSSLDSSPRRRGRKRLLVAVLAVILLAGVGVTAALLLQRSEDDVATVASTTPVTTSTTRPADDDPTANTGSGGSTSSTPSTTRPGSGVTIAPVALSSLEPVDEDVRDSGTGVVDVNGTSYIDTVYWSGSASEPSWVEYDLGRKFQRMTGVVGFNQDADAAISGTVQVLGDGVELFSAPIRLSQIAQLDIPVTNVLRLRLQLTYTPAERYDSNAADGSVVFADTELVP